MITASIDNQETYLRQVPKYLRLFKLIEIVNDKTVKEHFKYEFPFYYGFEQHMYFSSN